MENKFASTCIKCNCAVEVGDGDSKLFSDGWRTRHKTPAGCEIAQEKLMRETRTPKPLPTYRPFPRALTVIGIAVVAVLAAVLLSGCDAVVDPQSNDKCLEREIFKECLAAVPAGPVATKYNDWDEVVAECGKRAYWMAKRDKQMIKPECK